MSPARCSNIADANPDDAPPLSRLVEHAAAAVPAAPEPDTPSAAARLAYWYALHGPASLRGTAPVGEALAAALNADAGGSWDDGPRMSRLIAREARRSAPSLATEGDEDALAEWWLHARAGSSGISAALTPPWLADRMIAVPPAGAGEPFPIGQSLLSIHTRSETYAKAYRLDRPVHRIAFVFDLLLHLFDTPTRRLAFNPEALTWFMQREPAVPGTLTRFELLLGLVVGRGQPVDVEEAAAQATWFRAQACRAFPQFGMFASIGEDHWCARDRRMEVVGLAGSTTGLGQNLAMSAEVLGRAGVPFRLRDSEAGFAEAPTPFAKTAHQIHLTPTRGGAVPGTAPVLAPAGLLGDGRLGIGHATGPSGGIGARFATGPIHGDGSRLRQPGRKAVLLHVNADQVPQVLCNPLFDRHRDLHAIAFLLWELEVLPRAHRLCLELLDEVWCPTRYLSEIYAPHTEAPVRTVGKGLRLPPPAPIQKERWGLAKGAFSFLVVFDFHSSVERKNPLAAVEAFTRAFSGGSGDANVRLIVKTTPPVTGHWGDPNGMWERITAAAEADPRIQIIVDRLPFDTLLGLIASADCLISPHRAEGFGYMPAYALMLGCPVIATDYSGTRDFVTEKTGYPVPWSEREVRPGESIFPVSGATWADISVDALAQAMRQVRRAPDEARARAQAGQELMANEYSVEACAARYRAALEESGVLQ
ncbi:MAG: glycosyltransferase [Pseudomonadota bacterium]